MADFFSSTKLSCIYILGTPALGNYQLCLCCRLKPVNYEPTFPPGFLLLIREVLGPTGGSLRAVLGVSEKLKRTRDTKLTSFDTNVKTTVDNKNEELQIN